MTDSTKREAFTLKRWSKRKLAAARDAQPLSTELPVPAPTPPPAAAVAPAPAAPAAAPAADQLPTIESLTLDSDFTAFLRPGVDKTLRHAALRKLFGDPRFNVMDGLDVYIDDYSKSEVLPAAIARTLAQARYIFDPPKTRVNAEGFVEDVPPEEAKDAPLDGNAAPTQSEPSQDAPRVADAAPAQDAKPESPPQ